MGSRHAAFILRQLARWPREYGVEWLLEMTGVNLGIVAGGTVGRPGYSVETRQTSGGRQKLGAKYASRSAE
jgi:hypothetical protein